MEWWKELVPKRYLFINEGEIYRDGEECLKPESVNATVKLKTFTLTQRVLGDEFESSGADSADDILWDAFAKAADY